MPPSTKDRSAPWLAALAGFALSVWLFWPGYLSWDSAYQWWLVRHGGHDPLLPASMTALWRLTDAVLPGPAGLFLLQSAVFWSVLAMLAGQFPWTRTGRVLVVVSVGFWPALFALLPHLWKDIWLLNGLLWTVAVLMAERHRPSRGLRIMALALLVVAASFRINALAAVPPLLVWLIWREFKAVGWQPGRWVWRPLVLAAPLTILVATLAAWPQRLAGVDGQPIWPTVALWDVAAVSLAEDRMLIPSAWTTDALSLAELGNAFTAHSNTSIFDTGKIRINLHHPMMPADLDELWRVWLSLPVNHTRAYLDHRWRATKLLFGLDRAGRPARLVLQPGWQTYDDNPALAPPDRPARTWLQGWLDDATGSLMFAGWPYLVSIIIVLWLAITRRRGGLPAAVAASGLCMALPLGLIAPSAEFRFLIWPLAAALLALLLTWAEPPPPGRQRPSAPIRPMAPRPNTPEPLRKTGSPSGGSTRP